MIISRRTFLKASVSAAAVAGTAYAASILAKSVATPDVAVAGGDDLTALRVGIKTASALLSAKSSMPAGVELFWYGCPHCLTAVEKMKELEAKNDPSMHILPLPSVREGKWAADARLHYAISSIGRLGDLHERCFHDRQSGRLNPADPASLASWCATAGLSLDDVKFHFDSGCAGRFVDSVVELERVVGRVRGSVGVPLWILAGGAMFDLGYVGDARLDAVVARHSSNVSGIPS